MQKEYKIEFNFNDLNFTQHKMVLIFDNPVSYKLYSDYVKAIISSYPIKREPYLHSLVEPAMTHYYKDGTYAEYYYIHGKSYNKEDWVIEVKKLNIKKQINELIKE